MFALGYLARAARGQRNENNVSISQMSCENALEIDKVNGAWHSGFINNSVNHVCLIVSKSN